MTKKIQIQKKKTHKKQRCLKIHEKYTNQFQKKMCKN